MSWIAAGMAAVGAATSIAGSSASNKANAKSFVENTSMIKESLGKQWAQLEEQAREANDNVALEMSANRFNGLKLTATTTNILAEKEIAGNTAARIYNQSNMVKMMSHNALAKKAEDTMKSFGMEYQNATDKANQAIYGAGATAQQQNIGTMQMLSSAVKAGAQGYAMGSSMGSFFESGAGMGSEAGGAGGFSSYGAAASANYSGGF